MEELFIIFVINCNLSLLVILSSLLRKIIGKLWPPMFWQLFSISWCSIFQCSIKLDSYFNWFVCVTYCEKVPHADVPTCLSGPPMHRALMLDPSWIWLTLWINELQCTLLSKGPSLWIRTIFFLMLSMYCIPQIRSKTPEIHQESKTLLEPSAFEATVLNSFIQIWWLTKHSIAYIGLRKLLK
jgi:hypothetical protein